MYFRLCNKRVVLLIDTKDRFGKFSTLGKRYMHLTLHQVGHHITTYGNIHLHQDGMLYHIIKCRVIRSTLNTLSLITDYLHRHSDTGIWLGLIHNIWIVDPNGVHWTHRASARPPTSQSQASLLNSSQSGMWPGFIHKSDQWTLLQYGGLSWGTLDSRLSAGLHWTPYQPITS